ncbi:MAG: hypothetical protein EAX81_04800 [Candidatus Thorarchaeota archaeon]|nr:hypothetical protein [Candidatus Thorarchaeota archaeon]
MSEILKKNKFFLAALTISIILAGMTFGNIPGPATQTGVQTVNGTTFNFADYDSVDHEMLALFNYLDTIVNDEYQGYGEWNGWYAEEQHGLHHYVLAFMAYSVSFLFEITSGYRTSHYRDFLYDLIKKMNTTEAEWGNNSIEYKEWSHPEYNYVNYYWPNQTDTSDLYVGRFRGPANIMWTAHYALMMSLYERSFNTNEMTDEITHYILDWNNSLTTDGFGHPAEGGIWGTGIIPCEPYVVFVQCNSVPMVCTKLYDGLYGTSFLPIWDYGLNFVNNDMVNTEGFFADGYYLYEPTGFYYASERLPQAYPGLALSPWTENPTPKIAGYGNAWALAFLESLQPEQTAETYPRFIEYFMKNLSDDKAFIMDSYNNPDGFATYDILATLFALHIANQQKDYVTRNRLANFFFNSYNKVWSANGREMHFDTLSLDGFLQSIAGFGYLWGNLPVTIKDVTEARAAEFWNYPYISAADDRNIWVYQAQWDSEKDGFILNIQVDQAASLTFSNFASQPTAYSRGSVLAALQQSGSDYTLTLQPGIYQLVIM